MNVYATIIIIVSMLLSSVNPFYNQLSNSSGSSQNVIIPDNQGDVTPTPTSEWPYPPPEETATAEPTITETPTSTSTPDWPYPPPEETPTPAPTATATETPTPQATISPSSTPTEDTPATPKGITLSIDAQHYRPGETVLIKWTIDTTEGNRPGENWKISLTLPTSWEPIDLDEGLFDPLTWQLDIPVSSLHGKVSVTTSINSGDEVINGSLYDGDTPLSSSFVYLRAKHAERINKDGGEVEGKVGKLKVKIKFPKDALPEDADISMQTPERQLGALPYKGRQAFDFTALSAMNGNSIHQFNGPVDIEITYDPDAIGVHPSALSLFWYNEEVGVWLPLPGMMDYQKNVFLTRTNHFSLYALGENAWESRKVPPLDAAQVADFTGSASYSIPIEVPVGSGGDTALRFS